MTINFRRQQLWLLFDVSIRLKEGRLSFNVFFAMNQWLNGLMVQWFNELMKNKLKKKTKFADILFPPTFQAIQPSAQPPQQTNQYQSKHPTLKQRSQSASYNRQLKRTLSQQHHKSKQPQAKQAGYLKRLSQSRKELSKQPSAQLKGPAAQFCQLYYRKMQQNLLKQCELILKEPQPKRSLSTCKMQQISPNLFKLQRTIQHRRNTTSINFKEELSQAQLQDTKAKPISIQNSELGQLDSEVLRVSDDEKQAHSELEIGFSEQLSEDRTVIHESSVRKSMTVERKLPATGQSLINSKTRDRKLINLIGSLNAHMVSSKLQVRSSGFFKVCKVEFSSLDMSELSLFLEFCGQMVYRKVCAGQEKKTTDTRTRRNHLRKLRHLKDKLREKLFLHFHKQQQSKEVLPFFQDLLNLSEQSLSLQHTQLGLVLTDLEQFSLAVLNQQKLEYLFKAKQSFYFMMKLRGTFYLVKADSTTDLDPKFTLLIDFTSLCSGDQLVFAPPAPIAHYSLTQSKIYRLLPRLAQNFMENASREWGSHNTEATQELCSAKIGKVLVQNLERWAGGEVDGLWGKLWDINKKYEFVGGKDKNFFELHSQFDYSFFSRQPGYFRANDSHYSLHPSCQIALYRYPHHYQQIKVSQNLMQALVIPHLPIAHRQIRRHVVTTFFARRQAKRRLQQLSVFKMMAKHFRVELKVSSNLELYLEPVKSKKCYKLVLAAQRQVKLANIEVSQLSSYIQRKLHGYGIRKGLIYSKLVKKNASEDMVIHYKALHKIEAQFVYVSLYTIARLNLVQFKVHAFKMCRDFIVPLENAELTQQSLKQTIDTLIGYFKAVYFKTLLHEQARKSNKRRKDALEDFLKNQIRANPSNLRAKRKVEDKRKKLMRLTSVKWAQSQSRVYEDIISSLCHSKKGQLCYFTLRYLPSSQLQLARLGNDESVQLRVHLSSKLAIFKYQITVKEVISLADERGRSEVASLAELYLVFKQAELRIRQMIQSWESTTEFLFLRLKHFVDPNYPKHAYLLHPFKFKIIGSSFYQTKSRNFEEKTISTQLSIDFNLEKNSSHLTEQLGPTFSGGRSINDQMQQGSSSQNQKSIYRPFYTLVTEKWLVQVVDIVKEHEQWGLAAESKRAEREIRITNRQSKQAYLLSQWEGCFLTGLKYHQFNKKMIKRVISAIKIAL